MPRITRIAGSFVIVVIAYGAYALLAARFIEPPVDPRRVEAITQKNRDAANELVDLQVKELERLFPRGAWAAWGLKNPKILESNRAKLLFEWYKNSPDGSVEIHPCIIVFAYEGAVRDEEQRLRQSIILEAPDGAVLKFDQPLDLNRAKVGRLMGGRLSKQVTIRSDWKEPGPEDDLLIVTNDVRLTDQTITTPNPVDFRWGPHFGLGHDMLIKLLAGKPQPGMEASGPNIAGIESFEMRHVDRLHVDLGQNMTAPSGTTSSVPVEITCRGPFHFDAVGRVATFRDRVDVMKQNPSGPSDQIACELLSLYFSQRPGTGGSAPQAGSLDLQAERIEARGNPVVVTAPSQRVVARGQRLEYNLQANSIALDGGQEVFLQQGPNEIHARRLYYKSLGEGRLGQVVSQGPGWLRGQSADRPDQQLEAIWKDQLRVEPDKQNKVISLLGGAELKFQGVGQLQAKEIFFWLTELPPAAPSRQFQLRPDRMMARHNVHMNSPQLSSKVDELSVWFQEGPANGDQGSGGRGQGRGERPATTVASSLGLPAQQNAAQRFEVVGRLLRARVLLGGQQATVSNLSIEEGVCFRETQTSQPGERPLLIRGDKLEATDATGSGAAVTVTGRPARFEGRGLGLTGSNINLDRGANRLWIDGPGQMDLPLTGGVQGPMPVVPGVLTVDWRRGMKFDGHTATFTDSVVAVAPQQQLRTDTMLVRLQRPISFSQPNAQEQPQVEEIQCLGNVSMENRTFDQQQQLRSYDRLQVADLAVNILNGELKAGGPGWLNSVRRGSDNPLGSPTAPGNAPANVGPPQDQMNCLHVRFQESIGGNLLGRRLTFRGQVQTTYAPVNAWDAVLATDNPDKLGPQGVVVRCDELAVAEMLLPVGGRRAVELKAQGNTVVEGTTFTGRGNQITYAEAKGLLILKGEGRSYAELFRQLEPGAPASQMTAQEIHYWPKTKQLKVIGAQSLQTGQLSNGNGRQ